MRIVVEYEGKYYEVKEGKGHNDTCSKCSLYEAKGCALYSTLSCRDFEDSLHNMQHIYFEEIT